MILIITQTHILRLLFEDHIITDFYNNCHFKFYFFFPFPFFLPFPFPFPFPPSSSSPLMAFSLFLPIGVLSNHPCAQEEMMSKRIIICKCPSNSSKHGSCVLEDASWPPIPGYLHSLCMCPPPPCILDQSCSMVE